MAEKFPALSLFVGPRNQGALGFSKELDIGAVRVRGSKKRAILPSNELAHLAEIPLQAGQPVR